MTETPARDNGSRTAREIDEASLSEQGLRLPGQLPTTAEMSQDSYLTATKMSGTRCISVCTAEITRERRPSKAVVSRVPQNVPENNPLLKAVSEAVIENLAKAKKAASTAEDDTNEGGKTPRQEPSS